MGQIRAVMSLRYLDFFLYSQRFSSDLHLQLFIQKSVLKFNSFKLLQIGSPESLRLI